MSMTSEAALNDALSQTQSAIKACQYEIARLQKSDAFKLNIDNAHKALEALELAKSLIENQLKALIAVRDSKPVAEPEVEPAIKKPRLLEVNDEDETSSCDEDEDEDEDEVHDPVKCFGLRPGFSIVGVDDDDEDYYYWKPRPEDEDGFY